MLSVINAFRGFFKTSLGLTFLLWEALEHINHQTIILSQKEKLAEEMLERIVHIVNLNPLIEQVYADRFPISREKWNTQRISLIRDDPSAGHALIVGSIAGKQESRHADRLYCDDIEGADADISDVPNEEAIRFVDGRALPLLKAPEESRIMVVGTPHGKRPLVLELEKRPHWNSYHLELHDENMVPSFPSRFPATFCNRLKSDAKISRQARRLYVTQYLLRKWEEDALGFEMDNIDSFNYELDRQGYLTYPKIDYDIWNLDPKTGRLKMERTFSRIHISSLRFYIHDDPKHRDPKEIKNKTRPTRAAIVVVGIAPDFHAFVIDTWIKDTGNMGSQLLALRRMYELWAPYKVTYDAIGAQKWLIDQVKSEEKRGLRYMYQARWSRRRGNRLPKLSGKMEESGAGNQQKERWITEQLETWFSMGWLHLHEKQVELREHVAHFPSDDYPIDGADALSQGPGVWQPPISQKVRQVMRMRELLLDRLNPPMEGTGYRPLFQMPDTNLAPEIRL